jgi:hypothetical protein
MAVCTAGSYAGVLPWRREKNQEGMFAYHFLQRLPRELRLLLMHEDLMNHLGSGGTGGQDSVTL